MTKKRYNIGISKDLAIAGKKNGCRVRDSL